MLRNIFFLMFLCVSLHAEHPAFLVEIENSPSLDQQRHWMRFTRLGVHPDRDDLGEYMDGFTFEKEIPKRGLPIVPFNRNPVWGISGKMDGNSVDWVYFAQVSNTHVSLISNTATPHIHLHDIYLRDIVSVKRVSGHEIALLFSHGEIDIYDIRRSTTAPTASRTRHFLNNGFMLHPGYYDLEGKITASKVLAFDFISPTQVLYLFEKGYAIYDLDTLDSNQRLTPVDYGVFHTFSFAHFSFEKSQIVSNNKGAWLTVEDPNHSKELLVYLDFASRKKNHQMDVTASRIIANINPNMPFTLLDMNDEGSLFYYHPTEISMLKQRSQTPDSFRAYPPRSRHHPNGFAKGEFVHAVVPFSKSGVTSAPASNASASPTGPCKIEVALRKALDGTQEKTITARRLKTAFLGVTLNTALQYIPEGTLLGDVLTVTSVQVGFTGGATEKGISIPTGAEDIEVDIPRLAEQLKVFNGCTLALLNA